MNERIRELAEQAGYVPLPGFDFANSMEEVFIKKFAELVMNEVYDYILNATFDDKPWPDHAEVKQHFFGVE